MAKRITITPHLTSEEVEQHYRQAKTAIERSHWQIIRLIGQGKTSQEVAAISGYSPGWVRALVRRYNAEGPAVLGDQRQHNSGGQRLLSAETEASLRAEVERDIAAGKGWNGPQVATRLRELTGRRVDRSRGWELLRRWGLRPRQPRPRHVKADAKQQEVFKKRP
jgi:transposase